jgi:hypothetical protein
VKNVTQPPHETDSFKQKQTPSSLTPTRPDLGTVDFNWTMPSTDSTENTIDLTRVAASDNFLTRVVTDLFKNKEMSPAQELRAVIQTYYAVADIGDVIPRMERPGAVFSALKNCIDLINKDWLNHRPLVNLVLFQCLSILSQHQQPQRQESNASYGVATHLTNKVVDETLTLLTQWQAILASQESINCPGYSDNEVRVFFQEVADHLRSYQQRLI